MSSTVAAPANFRQPRVIAAWTNGMLLSAERAGLDVMELLAQVGMSKADLEDRDAPVDIHRHLHMVREIVKRLPGVSQGLRTGINATAARLGVLGYVLRYATTLRGALLDYIRFQRLVTDVTTWSIEMGPVCSLGLALHPLLDTIPSAAEVQIATIVSISRDLTGSHIVPRRVRFCHRPNSDPGEHAEFFGCSVEFDADQYELQLDVKDMDHEIVSANELAHQHFLYSAEAVLSNSTGLKQTSEAVRQFVVKRLQHGPPRREEVARKLGMTVRTLLRRLEHEEQTFEKILDSSRRELALVYATNNRLAVFEIAGLLGYAEPSAFFRAFRRWTGKSPQQHRSQLPVQNPVWA